MKKPALRVLGIVGIVLVWSLLALAGCWIAWKGASWFGAGAMMVGATIVATIALAILFGQYLAGTSDYFLSVDNPRPLDDHEVTITSLGWGFFSQSGRSLVEDLTGQGFADVRLFANRQQVLLAFVTLGFVRRVRIVWRGNAGQHPLGQA